MNLDTTPLAKVIARSMMVSAATEARIRGVKLTEDQITRLVEALRAEAAVVTNAILDDGAVVSQGWLTAVAKVHCEQGGQRAFLSATK